jgi:hypothetical protein
MNKYVYKVIKWLENPESVSQKESGKNADSARSAAYAYHAAYVASAIAAENKPESAKYWVNEYLKETGENKQDYLDKIEDEK